MKNYFTEDDEKLKWKTLSEKEILKTVVFDVMAYENISSTGVKGDYYVMKGYHDSGKRRKISDGKAVETWRKGPER